MPWKECKPMDERLRFVARLLEGEQMARLCREFGINAPLGAKRGITELTVKISDPALDARSLRLALEGPGGSTVAPDTVRAVEDAILTRARQLRIRDGQY